MPEGTDPFSPFFPKSLAGVTLAEPLGLLWGEKNIGLQIKYPWQAHETWAPVNGTLLSQPALHLQVLTLPCTQSLPPSGEPRGIGGASLSALPPGCTATRLSRARLWGAAAYHGHQLPRRPYLSGLPSDLCTEVLMRDLGRHSTLSLAAHLPFHGLQCCLRGMHARIDPQAACGFLPESFSILPGSQS